MKKLFALLFLVVFTATFALAESKDKPIAKEKAKTELKADTVKTNLAKCSVTPTDSIAKIEKLPITLMGEINGFFSGIANGQASSLSLAGIILLLMLMVWAAIPSKEKKEVIKKGVKENG